MIVRRADIWRRALKRYLNDEGYHKGDTSDDTWGEGWRQGWHAFCVANNAYYTADPDPINQPPLVKELFELLYAYELILRKDEGIVEPAEPLPMSTAEYLKQMTQDVPTTDEEDSEEHDAVTDRRASIRAAIDAATKRREPKATTEFTPGEEDDGRSETSSSKVRGRKPANAESDDEQVTRVRGKIKGK